MKYKLKEYLDAEIPLLRGKKGIRKLYLFLRAMRYQPGYHAIFLLRFCYVYSEAKGIHKYLRIKYNRELVNKYGIFYSPDSSTSIGIGLSLPHPSSIVFGTGVVIGDNCVIYQNVTFGAKKRADKNAPEEERYPVIGDNCIFYAGSIIIGPVYVADGTQVGANAVLMTDTEKSSIYAGIPATRKK